MKTKKIQFIVLLSFLILFFVSFYKFLSTPLWDYDFWWHIATGRYIVETGHLPEKDPFSYPSELAENDNLFPRRESVVLKQYWLSQALFYLVYKTYGEAGMIFIRSFILMLVILLVYWRLNRDGVKFYLIYPFFFLAFLTAQTFTGERPVLFTLLFSLFCFLILDSFKRTRNRMVLFLLIPLMLLWSNMHGGFIIGIAIIAAFVVGELLDRVLKRVAYTRRELISLCSISLFSIAVSWMNPNGLNALWMQLFDLHFFTEGIQEYQSVFVLYWNKVRSIDLDYIVLLVLSVVILIARARKMAFSNILLLSGLFIMSVTALRYVIFFMILGTIIVARETNNLIDDLFEGGSAQRIRQILPGALAVMIFVSSLVFVAGVMKFEKFRFEKATHFSVPEGAVDFIMRNRLSGNMFNDFGFGGYISWRLYPWKKNFIDTRSLNSTVTAEYGWVMDAVESIKHTQLPEGKIPLWKRLLDHYKVDFIVLDTIGIQGKIPPLLLKIAEEDAWVPVYVDHISAIFVRDGKENDMVVNKFRLPREIVYNAVTARAAAWATVRENPAYLISLGDIFYNRDMMKEAVIAYEYAVKRLPRNHSIRIKLEETKKKLEQDKLNGEGSMPINRRVNTSAGYNDGYPVLHAALQGRERFSFFESLGGAL